MAEGRGNTRDNDVTNTHDNNNDINVTSQSSLLLTEEKKKEVVCTLKQLRIGKDGYEFGTRHYYGYEAFTNVYYYSFKEPIGTEFSDTIRAVTRKAAKEKIKNKYKEHWFKLKFFR